jgi:hypothetical protein
MLELLLRMEALGRAEEPLGVLLMLEVLERAEELLGVFLMLEMLERADELLGVLSMLEVLMRAAEVPETGVRVGPMKTLPMRDFRPGMDDALLVLIFDGRRLPFPDAMLVGSEERVMVIVSK